MRGTNLGKIACIYNFKCLCTAILRFICRDSERLFFPFDSCNITLNHLLNFLSFKVFLPSAPRFFFSQISFLFRSWMEWKISHF
jgi:hypothetical protein